MNKKSHRNLCAASKKPSKRHRCGAKLAGKGCGCYLKLGHEGWHKNQDGDWPPPWHWHKPLIDVEKCGDRCSDPRAGATEPLFCQLSKGHVGEHACAGLMWPIQNTISTDPDCGALDKGWICTLTAGHISPHYSSYGRVKHSWPQSPVKAHIATAPHCGAVDTVNGWFCELAPGHSGEHQCGEYRWAHSYQEAAPPPKKCGFEWDYGYGGSKFCCALALDHKSDHKTEDGFNSYHAAPQCCGSNGCTLPPGHTGWHGDDKYTWHRLPTDTCDPEAEEPSWYSASPKREQPAPLTQKLVLHLASGDVELSEVEAKALREYLNRIYLTPGFCGEPYVISGMVSDGAIARQCDPGTVTVTGLDGKSFTLTNAVITHHFYPGKKP
jgi:hypothetical protein